jgi:hypothetical protein
MRQKYEKTVLDEHDQMMPAPMVWYQYISEVKLKPKPAVFSFDIDALSAHHCSFGRFFDSHLPDGLARNVTRP